MRRFVLIGIALLAAIIAAVLVITGDVHAAIRATARTSALCVGLAFARVRVHETSILLPVSHAAHYILILIAGAWEPIALVVGVAVYAVMLWNAARPNAIALTLLWITFLVAFAINSGRSLLYPAMTALLVLAGAMRWLRRPRLAAA